MSECFVLFRAVAIVLSSSRFQYRAINPFSACLKSPRQQCEKEWIHSTSKCDFLFLVPWPGGKPNLLCSSFDVFQHWMSFLQAARHPRFYLALLLSWWSTILLQICVKLGNLTNYRDAFTLRWVPLVPLWFSRNFWIQLPWSKEEGLEIVTNTLKLENFSISLPFLYKKFSSPKMLLIRNPAISYNPRFQKTGIRRITSKSW